MENTEIAKLISGADLLQGGLNSVRVESALHPPRQYSLTRDDFMIVDPSTDRFLVCLARDASMPETFVYPFSQVTKVTYGASPLPTTNPNPAIKLIPGSKILI
jgi:hypothetical protein